MVMSRVPVRAVAAAAQEFEDEVVLLHTETEEYFTLNSVGAEIWALVDGERQVAAIVAALAASYEMEEAELAGDVDELLDDLAKNQLITWKDETTV
jgi:coenzyme PQQ biosynthesis protein PqqD